MSWALPRHSNNEINRAGNTVKALFADSVKISPDQLTWAFDVINNWRSCHGYPINTFQALLRKRLKSIDKNAVVAQRLERMPSIANKLFRFQSMQLSRMQDIGGLRAVVSNIKQAKILEGKYLNGKFEHQLINQKDYIVKPKTTGYRSIHLVYRYKNRQQSIYDNLSIELQIRTKIQHAWATAVETMGTFLNYALKSSEGPESWLEFFSIAANACTFLENTTPIPKYRSWTKKKTFNMVIEKAKLMDVRLRLYAFRIAMKQCSTDKGRGKYHLITLNPENRSVGIQSFPETNLNEAIRIYGELEKRITKGDKLQVVLVSAGPMDNLRKAYPNFFLDTQQFIRVLDKIENET